MSRRTQNAPRPAGPEPLTHVAPPSRRCRAARAARAPHSPKYTHGNTHARMRMGMHMHMHLHTKRTRTFTHACTRAHIHTAAVHAAVNSPLAAQLDPASPLAAFLERTRSAL